MSIHRLQGGSNPRALCLTAKLFALSQVHPVHRELNLRGVTHLTVRENPLGYSLLKKKSEGLSTDGEEEHRRIRRQKDLLSTSKLKVPQKHQIESRFKEMVERCL